jgi:fructose-1,6-bisphosphatase/sedoheptulose 1,7-bisphosphatase-like protein
VRSIEISDATADGLEAIASARQVSLGQLVDELYEQARLKGVVEKIQNTGSDAEAEALAEELTEAIFGRQRSTGSNF